MRLETKKAVSGIPFILPGALLLVFLVGGGQQGVMAAPEATATSDNQGCVECHQVESPGIVGQWKESKHFDADIGCIDCHEADENDIDAYEHQGVIIATIVSPKDCADCHEQEYDEFQASHHADAGKILGSLDNVLAEVVEGYTVFSPEGEKIQASPVAVSGCLQCHGSEVRVLAGGKLDPATWPNTGVGRLNPDGSKGSCSACHQRHNFSLAQARQPENCGRCHLGPDHPQMEVYTESKHGIAFAANRVRFADGMASPDWIPGRDYEQGPTCSSCHMGATKTQPVTHDIGDRISWTLRPPVSEKIDAAALKQGRTVKGWQDRRADMQEVCRSCHGPEWVGNFYTQFDDLVNLYNDKFGRPATELFKMARGAGLFSNDVNFDDEIEFTYFLLWHHEGRRVRHGAAMMGPDYTQWHGMFEVAHRFYHEFVPQLEEIIEQNKGLGGEKAIAAQQVEEQLHEVLSGEMHRWFLGEMSEGEAVARKRAAEEFKKRYAQ
jgi:hydroxylamine dehydrogenase